MGRGANAGCKCVAPLRWRLHRRAGVGATAWASALFRVLASAAAGPPSLPPASGGEDLSACKENWFFWISGVRCRADCESALGALRFQPDSQTGGFGNLAGCDEKHLAPRRKYVPPPMLGPRPTSGDKVLRLETAPRWASRIHPAPFRRPATSSPGGRGKRGSAD